MCDIDIMSRNYKCRRQSIWIDYVALDLIVDYDPNFVVKADTKSMWEEDVLQLK